MPTFASYDGTRLAYHVAGDGPVLVCLPGGPGRASEYLGDLGGMSRSSTVIRLDGRGTGESETSADVTSYRLDRLALDLEALRVHLDLDQFNLLGHSAGSNVAAVYAGTYPERLAHLILLTGLPRILGLAPIGLEAAHMARSAEPWFATAMAAGQAYQALPDDASAPEAAALEAAMAPFWYGRWDAAAIAHADAAPAQMSTVARARFYEGYEADPSRLVTALGALTAPVLVVAGELDAAPTPDAAAELAKLFQRADLITIPGGGHYPWLDDPAAVVAALTAFLAS